MADSTPSITLGASAVLMLVTAIITNVCVIGARLMKSNHYQCSFSWSLCKSNSQQVSNCKTLWEKMSFPLSSFICQIKRHLKSREKTWASRILTSPKNLKDRGRYIFPLDTNSRRIFLPSFWPNAQNGQDGRHLAVTARNNCAFYNSPLAQSS